jgi:hypothetical protein
MLTDAQDVPQWVIDPVPGTGGGGAAAAGIGMGSNTVALHPGASVAQAGAVVFPASVLALGLTVWVEETFGTSQGLTHVGIGTAEQPDCWGVLTELTAATQTHAGVFLGYSGQPIPADGMVTLTAYGGLFDGAGAVYLTGHFATFHPSHALGLSWTPPGPPSPSPPDPQPYATEMSPGVVELIDATEVLGDTDMTRALTIGRLISRTALDTRVGLVELATAAETVTGTDTTRATHAAGVKAAVEAALATTVPPGPPLSVVRYSSGGTTLESTPTLQTLSTNEVGIGGAPVLGAALAVSGILRILGNALNILRDGGTAGANQTVTHYGTGTNTYTSNRARGTEAAPAATTAPDVFLRLAGKGHDGSAFPTGARTYIDLAAAEAWTSGAHGSQITFTTTLAGTTTQGERARIDGSGNLTTWETGKVGVGTPLTATLGAGASYMPLSVKGSHLFTGQSSVQERPVALIAPSFTVSTDATRESRLALSVYDATASREFLRGETASGAARIGFLGAAAVARQTVTGSRGGNAALASALTALANLGLVSDSSTA